MSEAEQEKQQEQEQQNAEALANLDALEGAEGVDEAEQRDGALAVDITTREEREQAEKAAQVAREAGAQAGAAMAVGFMETIVKMRVPEVEVSAGDRARLVESLAPVMMKHGGGMPEWLIPYQEEIRFGMTLAGVGFGVYMQVQVKRQQEAANDEKNQQTNPQPQQAAQPQTGRQLAPVVSLDPNAYD